MSSNTARGEEAIRYWIIEKLAQTLDCPVTDVDEHASIMALGIDSMTLIGLAGELAEFLQRDIRAEILWEYDTVAELATSLASVPRLPEPESAAMTATSEDEVARQSLTLIRPGNDVPPVFSVGFPHIARTLAEALPSRVPVGWMALDGPYRPPYTVRPPEKMAEAIAAELSELSLARPPILVGYSFGATIAFELACQLSASVGSPCVMLLEPPRIGPPFREAWRARLRRHVHSFSQRKGAARWRYALEKGQSVLKRLRWQRTRQRIAGQPDARWDVPDEFRWEVYRTQIEASLRGYRPRPYKGVVALAGRPGWLADHGPIWDQRITPKPLRIPLPEADDHQAVHRNPSAHLWINALQNWVSMNDLAVDWVDSSAIDYSSPNSAMRAER